MKYLDELKAELKIKKIEAWRMKDMAEKALVANMEIKPLTLCIELVPSTSRGLNLSSTLRSSRLHPNPVKLYDGKDWYDIANERKEHAEWKCKICGKKAVFDSERGNYFGLNCHERFEFDITKHEQKLVGLIVLCELCHHVKHIKRAEYLERKGKLDMKTVKDHFMTQNECGLERYIKHRADAEAEYELRSKFPWDIYFLEYAEPVKKYSKWRESILMNPSFKKELEFLYG